MRGTCGFGKSREWPSSRLPRLPMENHEMGDREASVFHRYTAYLAQRAGGIVLRWTIVGGLLGLALGSVTLTHWANWPVSHSQGYFVALLGLVSGAFLGRAIGSGRAQMILFQAQLAQHQHDFERKLLAVSAAVQAQPEPQPAAVPQPQPEAARAPVAPVAPAVEPEPVSAEPEPEPVYLPEPALTPSREFALPELPELPSLPEPAPAFVAEPLVAEPLVAPEPAAFVAVPEPVSFEPAPVEPEPAEVVQFVPRPEEPVLDFHPAPVAAAPSVLAVPSPPSLGIPPVSGETAVPAVSDTALAQGEAAGYGWQPEVSEQ